MTVLRQTDLNLDATEYDIAKATNMTFTEDEQRELAEWAGSETGEDLSDAQVSFLFSASRHRIAAIFKG